MDDHKSDPKVFYVGMHGKVHIGSLNAKAEFVRKEIGHARMQSFRPGLVNIQWIMMENNGGSQIRERLQGL